MSLSQSISDELTTLIVGLTVDQRRYIVARMDYPTQKEAAESIGLKVNTVYKWPPTVERAVELLSMDIVTGAKIMSQRSLAKAMAVKISGLSSKNEKIRQDSATEIIEWHLGKAKQQHEITGNIAVSKGYTTVSPDMWDTEEPKPDASTDTTAAP